MSEQRKYRSWTARQKLEIVLAGLKGDRSVRDVCREHGISEALICEPEVIGSIPDTLHFSPLKAPLRAVFRFTKRAPDAD